MSIIVAGFALGISLIVAIGPQNALLLKQGIRRHAIGVVITICAASDIIMILGGTAGVGFLVDRFPWALTILKYAGAAYLAYFTFLCFRDALTPDGKAIDADATPNKTEEIESFGTSPDTSGGVATVATKTRRVIRRQMQEKTWLKPALAAVAICWLNPAAYVDVLVMLGDVANQYGPDDRWLFAGGAICASLVWFPTIGYGAAKFSDVLAQPKVWRVINFAIGCIMIGLTIKLLMH